MIGAITIAGLAPSGVLLGFGVSLIGSGLFYVSRCWSSPMKVVSAVILTSGLQAGEIAAAGMVMGAILLALGLTGAISRFARLIPQSVSAGLQLGLGLLMGVLGIELLLKTPWRGLGAAVLLVLMRVRYCPAAPLMLVAATVAGSCADEVTLPKTVTIAWSLPQLVMPVWRDVWRGLLRHRMRLGVAPHARCGRVADKARRPVGPKQRTRAAMH